MNPHYKNRTLLSVYLSLLKVKYTARYADKLYNEHPYKHSLFGLSKMLSEYKIPNAGVEILNKEQGIKDLEPPFMAYAGNEFILVYEKDDAKVSYFWQGKRIKVDMDYFQRIWSGVVLLAEPTAESIEPNYRQNRKWEWMERVKPLLLLVIVSCLSVFSCVEAGVCLSITKFFILLADFLGGGVCVYIVTDETNSCPKSVCR